MDLNGYMHSEGVSRFPSLKTPLFVRKAEQLRSANICVFEIRPLLKKKKKCIFLFFLPCAKLVSLEE